MKKSFIIKICGLTRPEDLAFCQSSGVDLTGFIFAQKSPRFIEPHQVSLFPKGGERRVGVFAGHSVKEVLDIARIAKLDLLQLHGGESPEFCRDVGAERVIKVLWPDALLPDELPRIVEEFTDHCSFFLLDAGKQGGGSGNLLKGQHIVNMVWPKPWLLAGGLGVSTVQKALDYFAPAFPDGLDLNSALETKPGEKQEELVRKAVSIIRHYETHCR